MCLVGDIKFLCKTTSISIIKKNQSDTNELNVKQESSKPIETYHHPPAIKSQLFIIYSAQQLVNY